jgi:nitrite reductase/ring-hydroxylating ferredoxin subunit
MSELLDPGLPNQRYPFPAYANGWSRVGLTEELSKGAVRAIRYFGRELVLFRTESGRARVLDAHCRHLGAHLGMGGVVEAEGIRCPFHGWCWDGEGGACTDIPYTAQIPPAAKIQSWPVCERNGFIFLHYNGGGEAPEEEVPTIPEYGDPEWTPFTRLRWKIRSRSYDMGENAVDDVHFRYLHGAASMPSTRRGDVRGKASNLSTMKLDTPQGQVEGSIESTSVPGMGLVYVRGICDTLIVITGTPIDGEYVDQMFSYTQRTEQDSERERLGKALLRDLEKQMNEDIVVFEHKRYWKSPLLVPEDGPIADYRRRVRAQYTGDFAALDTGDEGIPAGLRQHSRRAGEPPRQFGQREFDELASFLRSAFRARKVKRSDKESGGVELRLLGRGDQLKHVLIFEPGCLEDFDVTDLRGYFSRPMVRKQIAAQGSQPLVILREAVGGL